MRYVVVVVSLAAVLAGCGSSGTSSSSVVQGPATTTGDTPPTPASTALATAPPSPPRPRSRCITAGDYKGLYSTVAAFKSDHDMVAPTQRMDGIAWYTILATEHGCVTGYSIDMYTTPASGASDMVFLTDGIYLPEDINRVVDAAGCTVYRSRMLTKASGYKFAVATGTAQGDGVPGHAEIDLTNDGSCPG